MHALGKKPLMIGPQGRFGLKSLKLEKNRCAAFKTLDAIGQFDGCRHAIRSRINKVGRSAVFPAVVASMAAIGSIQFKAVTFYLRDPGMRHDLHPSLIVPPLARVYHQGR